MAAETPVNQELLKKVYVDPVEEAVVSTNILQNNIKFDTSNKVGDEYIGAVMVRRPQGFTYAGPETMNTGFQVNGAIGGNTRQVKLKPSAILLEDVIPYGFAASMQNEDAAFNPQIGLIFSSMVESHDQMYELNGLYGGTELGITNTNTGSTPTGIQQVSKASWSPHIWGPMEGGKLDVYSDSALTTKITTDGPAILTSVDIETRTLTITYASAANYTAADAAKAALYIVQYGAVGNVCLGVKTILARSAAGSTVFDVDTSQYAYLRASTFSAGSAALTFAKLANAATGNASKGGMGELNATVNLYSFTDMMNDQAALRRYTQDNGGSFENGADRLVYYGVNGKLTIECDPMLKSSEAMITDWRDWKFIGTSPPTFNLPGRDMTNPKFAYELQQNAAWGVRRWSQAGVYCQRLARQTLITGIVNTSGPPGGGT